MNDQELQRLIKRDRGAPLPEAPDPRWIAARVQVQLGQVRTEPDVESGLLIGLVVLGALVPVALALYVGQPWLLALWPILLLLLTPTLLWKGANRS